MGTKIILTDDCQIPGDGPTCAHGALGERHDLGKEDASAIVRCGRALYLGKSDDPTKGQYTAGADDLKRIEAQSKARAAAAKAPA